MSEDKPLHVRVAEALGCKLGWLDKTPQGFGGYWLCECEGREHGSCLGVSPYDKDWRFGGPLIEEQEITVEPCSFGWEASKASKAEFGKTPLLAVCALIPVLKEAGLLKEAK